MVAATQKLFWKKEVKRKKNAPKIQVKSLKISFLGQVASYKLANQLKTKPHTGILQRSHSDLELYLYVLEI